MKTGGKREEGLKIPLPFDQAMKLAVQVRPPPEGWKAYEKKLKAAKRAKKKRKSGA